MKRFPANWEPNTGRMNRICYIRDLQDEFYSVLCFVDLGYQQEIMHKFPQITAQKFSYPRGDLTPQEYLALCLSFPQLEYECFF